MKQYVTEIRAIDPLTGDLKRWVGPNVPGESFEDAARYCQENGLGYCEVTGEFVGEIPWELAQFATTLFDDSIQN